MKSALHMYQSDWGMIILAPIENGPMMTEDELGEKLDDIWHAEKEVDGVWISPEAIRGWNVENFEAHWGWSRRMLMKVWPDMQREYMKDKLQAYEEIPCITKEQEAFLRAEKVMG